MILWIGWPGPDRAHDEAPGPPTLDLVDQVRGLEARLARLAANRRARLRADEDAALRALAPAETADADNHNPL